jgi:hypothetical protein
MHGVLDRLVSQVRDATVVADQCQTGSFSPTPSKVSIIAEADLVCHSTRPSGIFSRSARPAVASSNHSMTPEGAFSSSFGSSTIDCARSLTWYSQNRSTSERWATSVAMYQPGHVGIAADRPFDAAASNSGTLSRIAFK